MVEELERRGGRSMVGQGIVRHPAEKLRRAVRTEHRRPSLSAAQDAALAAAAGIVVAAAGFAASG